MLGRVEGVLLVLGIVAYTWSAIRVSRRETAAVAAEYAEAVGGGGAPTRARRRWLESLPAQLALVGLGIGLCVLGAGWLVDGAIAIARAFGVSDFVIGVTIVAAGTSLPEAATSVVAAIRGQRDIAVGNVVGSNIFNLMAILGLCASVAPGGVPVARDALILDFPVMIGAAIACLPICFTHHEIRRTEGALLLAAYAGYIAVIVWRA
jgi:cation:H+ antiporter